MLLLIFLMFVICSCIKLMKGSIEPGGAQIIIFMVVGLTITAIIKAIFKRSAKKLYLVSKNEEIEDDFTLSFEVLEIIGGMAAVAFIVYAIASGVFMYKFIKYFETDKAILIKPLIILTISEIILFISCYISADKKAIPVTLYLEADVLNKIILLLAGILFMAILAGFYVFIGLVLLFAFFGNSFGGG